MKKFVILLFFALSFLISAAPGPPGTVLAHSPAASQRFIGSPTLCILPNGDYLAAHDLFGKGKPVGRLYRSVDKGITWHHQLDFDNYFWSNLFVQNDNVYLLGTSGEYGKLIIRKSSDVGKTWTSPAVIREGEWHTAPVPIVEHNGRLWRAVEDAHTAKKWGARFRARMLSVPVNADFLDPTSWTTSNAIARETKWLEGKFEAWLEGNAVVTPEGKIVNILRVAKSQLPEKASILEISEDGTRASFDPISGFVDFPGASKKFVIRRDPAGPGYWALANTIPDRHSEGNEPGNIRNTLTLLRSDDLRNWEIRVVLHYHPDVARHGFQYPDWQFDGQDIIAVIRTAFDDEVGGARSSHDSNYITFHRWKNFRSLTRGNDIPMTELGMDTVRTVGPLTIKGTYFEISSFKNDEKAFANRRYTFLEIPAPYSGKLFTRLDGGAKGHTEVTSAQNTTLIIATAKDMDEKKLTGWKATGNQVLYSTPGNTSLLIYSREIKANETLPLPRRNWTGSLLIVPDK